MGIFQSDAQREKAFVAKATNTADAMQMEVYMNSEKSLILRHPRDPAGVMAACIANHVCHFGQMAHMHSLDVQKLSAIERPKVFRDFKDRFKKDATGTLIVLAAAKRLPLPMFKAHMASLAAEGFARVGKDTTDVSWQLPKDRLVYLFEVMSIKVPAP